MNTVQNEGRLNMSQRVFPFGKGEGSMEEPKPPKIFHSVVNFEKGLCSVDPLFKIMVHEINLLQKDGKLSPEDFNIISGKFKTFLKILSNLQKDVGGFRTLMNVTMAQMRKAQGDRTDNNGMKPNMSKKQLQQALVEQAMQIKELQARLTKPDED